MKTIYKYHLQLDSKIAVQMPEDAHILKIAFQGDPYNGDLFLWALIDTVKPMKDYHLTMYGTGHPFSVNNSVYLDTVFQGSFVWHIFLDKE